MTRNGELSAIARYLYEVGHLKQTKRTGWWLAGVKDPESVAEHSFRVAIIGYMLAVMEGADPTLTATICLFHDTPETRLGDIPANGKEYLSHPPAAAVAEDQVQGMAPLLRQGILNMVGEYAGQHSKEAQLAKDADKLECVMQAREYQVQSSQRTQVWIDNNLAKLHSASARRLGAMCLEVSPDRWWSTLEESFQSDEPVSGSGSTT